MLLFKYIAVLNGYLRLSKRASVIYLLVICNFETNPTPPIPARAILLWISNPLVTSVMTSLRPMNLLSLTNGTEKHGVNGLQAASVKVVELLEIFSTSGVLRGFILTASKKDLFTSMAN